MQISENKTQNTVFDQVSFAWLSSVSDNKTVMEFVCVSPRPGWS